ncbi:GTPase [Metabacillus idriensis]|uniref:GTPase n=1 Tax=Metabacillus idriensis TaxID=324768 RepID=UPI002813DA25|nr:GTPase [Metabacillus idriensis]MDR0140314.1 GTPase [Metabacillus idriensis]
METLEFKLFEGKAKQLINSFKSVVNQITELQVKLIIDEAVTELELLETKMKLEIAFIGQYSAGKSTIISALTNDEDIKVGQDVTTDKPKSYQWGNVLLIDTPGILAGNDEHDSLSLRYMDHADLLVYVITVNGFDDIIGKNFRKLAFEQNRASRMLLVMNKISSESISNKDNWIESINPVIEPLSPKELKLTCIDAQDYIDGFNEFNSLEGKELISLSNFMEFQDQLNHFVKEKGLIGRIITPLNLIETYSNQIINTLTADTDEVLKLQELLRQKHFLVNENRKRLERRVLGEIHNLSSTISKKGHEMVSLITPAVKQEMLVSKGDEISIEIDKLCFDTSLKIENIIEEELSHLLSDINELMESQLAKDLKYTLNISFDYKVEVKDKRLNDKAKKAPEVLQRIGGLLNTAGKNFKDWTQNTQKVGEKGLKAVTGSDAHKAILEIGHFFGKKFKPYEAQKLALKLGKLGEKAAKFGKVLGGAQVVVAPLMAVYEERQESKYAESLQKARMDTRDNFNEWSKMIKDNYTSQLNEVLEKIHDKELEDILKSTKKLRNTEKMRGDTLEKLERVIKDCDVLIAKAK